MGVIFIILLKNICFDLFIIIIKNDKFYNLNYLGIIMAPTISCFYTGYNRAPVNITFIKFENFVKIIFNDRAVILTNKQLVDNFEVFQAYVMSLLLTEDTTKIGKLVIDNTLYYGISTRRYWKSLYLTDSYTFISLQKSAHRNPLNCKEPKRESSWKKYNKFMRLFYDSIDRSNYIIGPRDLIEEYYDTETADSIHYYKKYMEYQIQTEILRAILHNYGYDIYASINQFVKI